MNQDLEAIRQQHEAFLSDLESLAVQALATGDWDEFEDFISDARGISRPRRLQRVSLIEFLETHPCTSTPMTTTGEVGAAEELETPSSDRHPTTDFQSFGLTPMVKPIGYYTGGLPGTLDRDILDQIEEQFGSQLQGLTADDKAAVLICLIESAINPQQVLIQENFFTNCNGGELWGLAQQLSGDNQLNLSVAILNQLVYGVREWTVIS